MTQFPSGKNRPCKHLSRGSWLKKLFTLTSEHTTQKPCLPELIENSIVNTTLANLKASLLKEINRNR